jgi:hypothetical protein
MPSCAMLTPESSPTPDEELIADLLDEWEARRASGEDVMPGELCRDRPDLVPVVAERIALLRKVEWLGSPDAPSSALVPDTGPPADPPPPTGPLDGRYRLDELLGEGGFGQVWRGFDLKLGRTVAVKVPRPGRTTSAGNSTHSLLDEARKAAGLEHPGIVPVHDFGSHGGTEFIVYKFVKGPDLHTRMRQERLDPGHALLRLAEVADALHYAHLMGVLHLDVKPANIFFPRNCGAMLTDFGIARSRADHRLSQTARGTPGYAAPELGSGEPADIDARADVYSLGVVLRALLTGGGPPRAGKCRGDPGSLPGPRVARPIVRRCLAERPSGRYPTALDVAEEMRAAASRLLTESEWRVCRHPLRMLSHVLASDDSARKVRLFACACARTRRDQLGDDRSRAGVEVAERYADGRVTADELRAAAEAAWGAVPSVRRSTGADRPVGHARVTDPDERVVHFDVWSKVVSTALCLFDDVPAEEQDAVAVACTTDPNPWIAAVRAAHQIPADVQRAIWWDLFGHDLFEPPRPRPWLARAHEAAALAAEIDRTGEHCRLVELAKPLNRAGCDEQALLVHCQSDRPHYRGCWVIDLLLSRGAPGADPGHTEPRAAPEPAA